MNAGARSPTARSPWQKLFRWLRVFLPFAVLLVLNPFGCSNVADTYSERITLRLIAPFYGGRWQGEMAAPTLGQNKVAVVLIDEASLAQFAEGANRATWPPSRREQFTYILQTVLDRKPAAVLLDWTFHADTLSPQLPKPDQPEMAESDDIRPDLEGALRVAEPPRLFLGSKPLFKAPLSGCALQWVGLDQVRAADDVAVRLRHWGKTDQQPELPAEVITLRSYSLEHYALLPYQLGMHGFDRPKRGCPGFEADADYLASPAFAMFMTYCEHERGAPDLQPLCNRLLERPRLRTPLANAATQPSYFGYAGAKVAKTPIALLWPAFRSPMQTRIDDLLARTAQDKTPPSADGSDFQSLSARIRECRQAADGWLPAPIALFWSLFWSSAAVDPVTPCEYGVDVVTLRDLIELDGLPRAQRDMLDPIRDRYVFIGLDLASVPDRVVSPLYPSAPGVLQHAVAFENLVTLGDGVLHDSRDTILGMPSMVLLVFGFGTLMSLVPALLPVEAWFAAFGGPRLHPLRTPAVLLLGLCLSVLVPLLFGLIFTSVRSAAPINWVSVIPAMAWALEASLDAVGGQIGRHRLRRGAASSAIVAGVIVVVIFLSRIA